jgi:hypothetical protein
MHLYAGKTHTTSDTAQNALGPYMLSPSQHAIVDDALSVTASHK